MREYKMGNMKADIEGPDPTQVDNIFMKCRCCSCARPMTESTHVNLVMTNRKATWKFPVTGNLLDGRSGIATAVVCDQCLEKNEHPLLVLQFEDGQVIYHDIDTLEKI